MWTELVIVALALGLIWAAWWFLVREKRGKRPLPDWLRTQMEREGERPPGEPPTRE